MPINEILADSPLGQAIGYIATRGIAGFHCSSETFVQAQQAANNTRLTHFIGNLPTGREIISTDPEALRMLGCGCMVPVAPEGKVV